MSFWGPGGFGMHLAGRPHGRGKRFKRGILKFVVLKLLAEESRHGYDLIRAFRHKGWGGGGGSIYPILQALEEEGLIAGRDEGERRTYEITEKGRRHLDEHGLDLGSFFESEDEDDEREPASRTRDELRDAAGRLMQAVSQLGPSSSPETVARVRELLDKARRDIYSVLAQE
ncbi:MAG: PadR family transcriptional regulator [Candidatus Eremiobacteraeota bacterium]|nr:PadR family transcriptional regulator [Candidatus Eremiobacteraeota bacterium]